MITKLRAQNFKSWKDTGDLRLAPLTGLFGTNSSGKSSILQVLLMLKQSAGSFAALRNIYLGDEESDVNLGSFASLIYGHDVGNSLSLSLEFPISEKTFSFDVSLREENQRIVVSSLSYSIDGHRYQVSEQREGMYEHISDGQKVGQRLAPPISVPLIKSLPREGTALIPDQLVATLRNVAYLGPLREAPRRWYLFGGIAPPDVGKGGARTIQALLAANTTSLEENVAKWLKRMKLIHSFKLRPIAPNRSDHEVLIKTTEESPDVLLTDVGFGVSQLLPVLVLCYYVPEGTTILLEQPELHLHPSAQSVLADVFIDVVKNRKLQIIFESHSEHLLRRIQRRIAEEQFPAQDASMYFCHIEKGESHATPLELTDEGFIKNWPPDFFGDEMGEVAALAKESIRRRRQVR